MKAAYLLLLIAGFSACSPPAPDSETAANSKMDMAPQPAEQSSSSPENSINSEPVPESTDYAAPAGTKPFTGPEGIVHLAYPDSLQPTQDFSGRSLMRPGWRVVWNADDMGKGKGIVRFSQEARPANGPGSVTEMLQIGVSSDPKVVKSCTSYGLDSGSGAKLPDRSINGTQWTAYSNGDAGMSQQIKTTDLRTVYKSSCYAISRITYTIKAAETPPASAMSQSRAAALMDAVMNSIRLQ